MDLCRREEAYAGQFTHLINATKLEYLNAPTQESSNVPVISNKKNSLDKQVTTGERERERGSWQSWLKTSILQRHPAQTARVNRRKWA